MSTFKVVVSRKIHQSGVIEVEAVDEEEAAQKAQVILDSDPKFIYWTLSGEPYSTNIEEIKLIKSDPQAPAEPAEQDIPLPDRGFGSAGSC